MIYIDEFLSIRNKEDVVAVSIVHHVLFVPSYEVGIQLSNGKKIFRNYTYAPDDLERGKAQFEAALAFKALIHEKLNE